MTSISSESNTKSNESYTFFKNYKDSERFSL